MVGMVVEPGAAGWKVQTNPLSYGGTLFIACLHKITYLRFPFDFKSLRVEESWKFLKLS